MKAKNDAYIFSGEVYPLAKIRCVVERITYQNPENGYTVLKVSVKGYNDLIPVIGNLFDVNVGSVLLVEGEWKVDGKYGRQFAAESWEETMPATVYGIEKYLGSGLVKGIGPKFARRIVQKFGTDTIDIIDTEPGRLLEINGIGKKRVELIKASWEQQKEVKNVMLFLQDHGVSTSFASKIYRQYGNDSISIVKENPFRLADDIWGIGFVTADKIAEKLGFQKTDFARCRSGISYTLGKLSDEGHVYAEREQLIKKATELLDTDETAISSALQQMLVAEELKVEGEAIYLPTFYYAEIGTASKLLHLFHTGDGEESPAAVDIPAIEAVLNMHYDEIQAEAIRTAVSSRIMVLTGGPGTGKTTTTQGIITALQQSGLEILLAAPTGRAAKRMSEATGMEAKTIHRLLEFKPPEGYQKNENNPLEGDVLILDECSMIDLALMNSLLKAIPGRMKLIMVGDIDQLPSVGAGNVLRDIIDSGVFPVVRLTKIFRQAQSSRIITNAHRINAGQMPDLSNGKKSDFFFMGCDDPEVAANLIVQLVQSRLPKAYHTDASSIQVLTPMQRGVVGAVNLNQMLQKALNPGESGLRRGGYLYRESDKVMQIRNNYEKEVFNGDIGQITRIDYTDRKLMIQFDGREVAYDATELDEIVHAYATTIHKAQGSEYPVVVMPIMMTHYVMLQRNLLYTGITRAKRLLVIVGTRKALACCVKNLTVTGRNSLLAQRLMGEISAKEVQGGVVPDNEISAISRVLKRLSGSSFRAKFRLSEEDISYIDQKGIDMVEVHAEQIIRSRIAPPVIPNDGKQTPMHGHPVFIAQHATATCCRGCLEKWHHIPAGRELTEAERDYVKALIMEWIGRQVRSLW